MTVAEARAHFGLKDTDKIVETGLKAVKYSAKKQKPTDSFDKEKLEKDIEACDVLLMEIKRSKMTKTELIESIMNTYDGEMAGKYTAFLRRQNKVELQKILRERKEA